MGYSFSKGYYPRYANNKFNGRVTRLLVTPLIKSLIKLFGNNDYLEFIDSFRYPLAGECSFRKRILRDLTISNNHFMITSLRYFNPIGAHPSGFIGENPNDIPNNLMPYVLKVAVNNNTKNNLGSQFDMLNIFGDDYNTSDGTCERDFIHVVDLAKGHVSALNKMVDLDGYNVFNLGTGNPTSVLELVTTFKKVNNIDIPYKFANRREGDLDVTFCDPDYTYRVLNWKTEKTIEDMCRDAWYFQKLNPTGF